ncbi:hypothetical protein JRQ81_008915 [Phrynocephalus forsythii]|uniref:Large ribosomal subunit protein bL34m n=1 Tax=Phrynocephalus forsythii TaxID=171643 RepID=A0A9Q1AT33_9SAUR|nr:hypothetical protein JRQ81_008915 [Phrynocephalus forsythii]
MQRALADVLRLRGVGSPFLLTSWGPPLGPCWAQKPPGPAVPWSHQPARGKARGNEYQPSNIKRKHKHGWIKRIRSASGIEVILRRILKGRKSLSH